ncbi:MAG: hypothetical protein JST26_21025 [Bacteroidetes bacterium]|nr:hypothetical protein [Bacteroidota bacterium]
MKTLIHMVILSCKKASFLFEKKQLTKLSFMQSVQLRWHMAICDGCSKYASQSLLINSMLQHKKTMQEKSLADLRLSEQAKTRINQTLRDKLKNN